MSSSRWFVFRVVMHLSNRVYQNIAKRMVVLTCCLCVFVSPSAGASYQGIKCGEIIWSNHFSLGEDIGSHPGVSGPNFNWLLVADAFECVTALQSVTAKVTPPHIGFSVKDGLPCSGITILGEVVRDDRGDGGAKQRRCDCDKSCITHGQIVAGNMIGSALGLLLAILLIPDLRAGAFAKLQHLTTAIRVTRTKH